MNSNRSSEQTITDGQARRAEELERRVLALKGRSRSAEDQGYIDRLQRASSWLAKAYRVQELSDLESRFIFAWIALNALYGVPEECLVCVAFDGQGLRSLERRRDGKLKQGVIELDWFMRQVSDLDGECRILDVLKKNWPTVEECTTDRFLQRGYWTLESDERLKSLRKADIERVKKARSGRDAYGCLSVLFVYRFRVLRNQLFHGAATDLYSKRRERDEARFKAQTALLEELVDTCLVVLKESGEGRRWPCIPAPRLESPGHRIGRERPCRLAERPPKNSDGR